jgi:hypothetical protein
MERMIRETNAWSAWHVRRLESQMSLTPLAPMRVDESRQPTATQRLANQRHRLRRMADVAAVYQGGSLTFKEEDVVRRQSGAFDDVVLRQGNHCRAESARPAREFDSRPNCCEIQAPVSASLRRSISVSMPRPCNSQTTSSVATLPAAPGA